MIPLGGVFVSVMLQIALQVMLQILFLILLQSALFAPSCGRVLLLTEHLLKESL